MSSNDEWLPVEVELPPGFPVLGLVVEGSRNVQLWGSYAVWEVDVPEAPVLGK